MGREQLSLDFTTSASVRHRKAVAAVAAVQPELFAAPTIDIDIHIADRFTAVASIAGPTPERAAAWLMSVVSAVDMVNARKARIPVASLHRLLWVRSPAKVTLDAGATVVARALWAHALGLAPLRVERQGSRLLARSVRGAWPSGFRVADAPWMAIAALVEANIALEVAPDAHALFNRRLNTAGVNVAQAGVAGSAVVLTTTHSSLLENAGLDGLAYDGGPDSGRYRLPLALAGPLLDMPTVTVPDPVAAAIRQATRRPAPLTLLPQGFPWTLYGFQAIDAGHALKIVSTSGGVLLAGDMGSGKGGRPHDRVLTPHGWTTYGQLRVGDHVVGSDGRPTAVTGVYPRGALPVYKVSFSDRRSLIVDGDHLWAVQTPVMKKRGNGFIVKSTRELAADLRDKHGNARWFLPLTQPVQFAAAAPLPVDPYLLGVLIGDGTLYTDGVRVSTADDFVREEITRLLPAGLHLAATGSSTGYDWRVTSGRGGGPGCNRLLTALRDLNLAGKRSWEKHIPDRYLLSSVDDRVALLQGLLDTDGGRVGRSSIEYSSSSSQLADDVRSLVESLGGTARMSVRNPTYTYNGQARIGRPSYRLCIALPDTIDPFRLPRKQDPRQPRLKYGPTRAVVSVEPYGRDDVICISVAATDQLYVTDHYVVTHNTTVALALAATLKTWPLLVVAPLSAFSTWERQLGELGKSFYVATESPAKSWEKIAARDVDAVVLSYDRLPAFTELVEQYGFAAVIADEVQRIRTPGSRRSRALRAIASSIPIRIGLSGTPITNTMADVLPVGAFLAPSEWPPRASSRELADVYPGDPQEGLTAHLSSLMVRRRMSEIPANLPKRVDHRIYVQLSANQRRALDDLTAQNRHEAKSGEFAGSGGRMHAFVRLQQMRRIVNDPQAAGVGGPNPKIAATMELVSDMVAIGRKGVVFCADRNVFRQMGEQLDAAGIGWVGIWGSTPAKDRVRNEKRFHTDPNIKVVLCTIQAGSESWSASPTATWLVSMSYKYSPSMLAQMEARVYRMNSDPDGPDIHICYVHASAPGGTLDDRMCEIVAAKKELFAAVVDRDVVRDTTNAHLSMNDLLFMLTGKRDKRKDVAAADAAEHAQAEVTRKSKLKAGLYKLRGRNRSQTDVVIDDGSNATVA